MHENLAKYEVAHTAAMVASLVANHLIDHRLVKTNPAWRQIAETLITSATSLHKMASTEVMAENRLRDLIRDKAFHRGEYVLSSGQKTSYFFDMKAVMLDPTGINLLADAMLERVYALDCDAIAGVDMGGVPLVTVMSAKSCLQNDPIPMLIVRKQVKDHGTQRLIEGDVGVGLRVVVVDDVASTGQSLITAVEALENAGCNVESALTVIDRLEGACDNLRTLGIGLNSLFTRTEFDA